MQWECMADVPLVTQELPPGVVSIHLGACDGSNTEECVWKQHPWQSHRLTGLLHYTRDPSLTATQRADNTVIEAAAQKVTLPIY